MALLVLERGLITAPVGMELARPLLEQPEPAGVEHQVGGAARLAPADQASVLQDLYVLVDRWKRQVSHPGEVADGARLQAQNVNDLPPVRVCESPQHTIERGRALGVTFHIT